MKFSTTTTTSLSLLSLGTLAVAKMGGRPSQGQQGFADRKGEPSIGKRFAYPEAYYEERDILERDPYSEPYAELFEREAYPEGFYGQMTMFERNAFPEAYFEERDLFERDPEPEAHHHREHSDLFDREADPRGVNGHGGLEPPPNLSQLPKLFQREAEARGGFDGHGDGRAGRSGRSGRGGPGGQPEASKRDAYPEAYAHHHGHSDIFEREAYPEAYFEERDFFERDAYPEAHDGHHHGHSDIFERDAYADAYADIFGRDAEAEAVQSPKANPKPAASGSFMPKVNVPKGDKIIKDTLKCNNKDVCSGTIEIQAQT